MSAAAANSLGLYLSIPFCRSKCTYCNFASGVFPAGEHARYVDRLVADLEGAGAWAQKTGVELPHQVDTVYLGGGTPSLLEPELVTRLFDAIRGEFDLEPGAEITVECAPGQIGQPTLEALVGAGVNRVSLGVQSFIDREAAVSGRLHNRAAVFEDMRRLRVAGIANLSVDLIAGLAGQTFTSWEESLEALVSSGASHASIYMLEVDEDSRLGREMLKGGARYHAGLVPGDDAIAQMYLTAIEMLGRAGLEQYEISNFCQGGWASRHNLRYWERRPYLGLGLDSSSMLRQAGTERVLRSTTSFDLKQFMENSEPEEIEWLNRDRQHEEAWFLGLRLNAGVDVERMEREFGAEAVAPALEVARRLAADGLLIFEGKNIRLTERGRLLSNDVFQEFLELEVGEPA